MDFISIEEFDGRATNFSGGGIFHRLEVLPGEHSVGVTLVATESTGPLAGSWLYSKEPYTLCMKAEAGKEYVIRSERAGLVWRPRVFEYGEPLTKKVWNPAGRRVDDRGARVEKPVGTPIGSEVLTMDCRERRSRSVGLYERICSEGNAQGCFTLGELYKDGREVPQNEGRAATLFEKACNGGVALGCNSLGVLYKDGRGVPQDERRAATLFETACTGEVAQGCFNLGLQYVRGRGVPQDERQAATFFEKACTGEVAQGCFNLGVLYKEGRGVSQDERRATSLFQTACQGGMSTACGP
jgi:hypothetical protein